MRYFPDKHSGRNISVSLDEMIEKLGLHQNDIQLDSVNDNASNMKLTIRLGGYLSEYYCDIHTIELGLKDAIKKSPAVLKILEKTKKIAKKVNKSSPALSDLKNACESENIPFKKPVNPPNTRWAGYYLNLKSILYLKKPLIHLFSESEHFSEFYLSQADWKLLEKSVELLKHYKDTILIWESETSPTMHRVIERVYTLEKKLSEFIYRNSS